MTEHAIKLMINKLGQLSSEPKEQKEIINQSIINGWKGIFPLKEEFKKKEDSDTYGEKYDVGSFYKLDFYEQFKPST